ncbi:MAG: SDR family NAD(P)-dependent oxidoreductase [Novosphingobium sp.]|nr:SDR family NAD(P)-dependent oxidoreductase [Novosphingobium sp.]
MTEPVHHPALAPGRGAVITGAAGGIGLAVARRCAAAGMRVCLADTGEGLDAAVAAVSEAGAPDAFGCAVDVSDAAQVNRLRDSAFERFGGIGLLMNNAGVGGGGNAFSNPEGWDRVLGVNLHGVLNGVQAFTQAMVDQARPAVIVNTGSKQGITSPPGDTAYNASKAAVKSLTEGLAHSLRAIPGCQVTAHLLIPGFTYSGMMTRHFAQKPAAAWTCGQVADALFAGLVAGDFYILCQDNETPRALDERRILWAAGDIVENRPALSRWHPDFKDAYEAFIRDAE